MHILSIKYTYIEYINLMDVSSQYEYHPLSASGKAFSLRYKAILVSYFYWYGLILKTSFTLLYL